jgi:hypothetical protein
VCKKGCHQLFASDLLFFDTIRGISHAISSLKICTPE